MDEHVDCFWDVELREQFKKSIGESYVNAFTKYRLASISVVHWAPTRENSLGEIGVWGPGRSDLTETQVAANIRVLQSTRASIHLFIVFTLTRKLITLGRDLDT